MPVEKRIMEALSGLVNGNIWPLAKPEAEECDEYITFNPARIAPDDWGDDEDQVWTDEMQVHYVAKGHVDYTEMRSMIRDRLKEAGFVVTGFPYTEYVKSAESDGRGLTHLVCECWMEEL